MYLKQGSDQTIKDDQSTREHGYLNSGSSMPFRKKTQPLSTASASVPGSILNFTSPDISRNANSKVQTIVEYGGYYQGHQT